MLFLSAVPPADKDIQKSAFVSTLRERMAQLRHSKLYSGGKKEVVRVRGVNRNPMKVPLYCMVGRSWMQYNVWRRPC
jgi:hypothetical protein